MKLGRQPNNRVWLAAMMLIVSGVTVWNFWPCVWNGFVRWDDPLYLKALQQHPKLSWNAVAWAFTTTGHDYYEPLPRILNIIDYQAAGFSPFRFHFTNLILHALNAALTVLLGWLLLGHIHGVRAGERLCGAGFIGLVFAIHPLQVESVAWMSERKNVLCGFFMLASLCAYLTADKPRIMTAGATQRIDENAWRIVALLLGVAALLSKPMAVSLPVVMLVLDWYPLERIRRDGWWPAIREKSLLWITTAILCVVTIIGQMEAKAMSLMDQLSLAQRSLIAVRSTWFYLWKLLWPTWLSPYYPLEGTVSLWQPEFFVCLALFGLVCVLAVASVRRVPGVLAAWLSYLALLLPMAGVIQVGGQAAADRFMYLTMLPILLLVVVGLLHVQRRLGGVGRGALAVLGICYLVFFGFKTRAQIAVWRTDESLWRSVLAVYPDCARANDLLAVALTWDGQPDQALPYAQRLVQLAPESATAHETLGRVNFKRGDYDAALRELTLAVALNPELVMAHYYLAATYSQAGALEHAWRTWQQLAMLDPALARQAVSDLDWRAICGNPDYARRFAAALSHLKKNSS